LDLLAVGRLARSALLRQESSAGGRG